MLRYLHQQNCEVGNMYCLSYKRLFKKLIDIEMTNTELMQLAKVSRSTFYKIKNNENVITDVLKEVLNYTRKLISDALSFLKYKN